MNKKTIISTVVVLIVIVSGIFIWQSNTKTIEEPISLVMNVWPGYSHTIIAKERGFFEDEGVRVSLTVVEDYSESIQLFEEGVVGLLVQLVRAELVD